MSTNDQPQPTEPQQNASNKGVAVELSAEALHNLAGWFDVLIQMDLAQKVRNEIRSKYDEKVDIQDASSKPKEVH